MKTKKEFFKYYFKVSHLFVLFFLLAKVVCPLQGQTAGKKTMTGENHELWSSLGNSKLSSDGSWIASRMIYEKEKDTLMIINTKTKKIKKIPNCLDFEFSPNGKWIVIFAIENGIDLINLGTDKSKNFNSRSYFFSKQEDKLGILDSANSFFLIDLENGSTKEFKDVMEFTFSPNGKTLALITVSNEITRLNLVDTKDLKRTIPLTSPNNEFSNLVWNDQSNGLVFMESEKNADRSKQNTKLYEYRSERTPNLLSLQEEEELILPMNTIISNMDELFYAADGKRIFFNIRPNNFVDRNLDSLKNNLQIWKGDDPWIVPQQLKLLDPDFGPRLMLWKPKNNIVLQIGTQELPVAYLGAQENFAITFNPKQYELSNKYKGTADFYLKDLSTGKKKLLLEKFENIFGNLLSSPKGRYINYYKEGHWWVYDTKAESHTNITINFPFELDNKQNSFANIREIFGCGGWDVNEQWLFIYDEFDIWKVSSNGKEIHKITDGRKTQTTFRIYDQQYEDLPFQRFGKFPSYTVDIQNEVLLSASSISGSGYYLWKANNKILQLVWSDTKIDNIRKAKNNKDYIYREESYNIPSRIYFKQNKQRAHLIYESIPQTGEIIDTNQELINYSCSENKNLYGILMYPDNYEKGKKYPMLVHIYEKQSHKFHNYISPTLLNPNGFNPKLFTSQGYFVLYPDIAYKSQDPGLSATECVKTAVETVVKMGLVKKSKIGLIGHSFGGYEATFIATQTNIFATIIAGAAITDLTSMYLSVGDSDGRPDMYRFENQQFRFECSFFDDPQAYYRNSPVHQAENVDTPILLWTGADDPIVNANQSKEFYLALRRLGKEVTLLYYPNETHSFSVAKNQKDLTERIIEWSRKYLKD